MLQDAITSLIQKKDTASKKALFELLYPRFSAIAKRYSKSQSQSVDCLNAGFNQLFSESQNFRNLKSESLMQNLEMTFIKGMISHLKSIRNEYYVSSTVHAADHNRSLDLFASMVTPPDYNQASPDTLLSVLQSLVPSQRLIFNLHVIDGHSLETASELLDSSIGTIKSNLEKARFNFQKQLDKQLRQEAEHPKK